MSFFELINKENEFKQNIFIIMILINLKINEIK